MALHVQPAVLRTHNGCRHMSKKQQRKMEQELWTDFPHWTFFLIPVFRQYATGNPSSVIKNTLSNRSPSEILYGEYGSRCPRMANVDCPVYYVLNHDENRIPENIVHARCSCTDCIRNKTDINGCRPVNVHILVWRRDKKTCDYFRSLEPVPVSCQCATTIHKAKPL
ncbi:hypothetical protein MAR_016121 [Mya arenaria]|uniref:Uncharacterized protein n=2 Tax=Mya arenaria TaxID=6604 RepID=A0ABY7FJ31_MYAAR|nr:uncharacterized protein LOC128211480 isoform X2 [Mya arenaria]WAR22147.1 hypothetical protein MAR_016121 [Mya arenaria]